MENNLSSFSGVIFKIGKHFHPEYQLYPNNAHGNRTSDFHFEGNYLFCGLTIRFNHKAILCVKMLWLHVSSLGVVVLATAPQQQLYITVSYQA